MEGQKLLLERFGDGSEERIGSIVAGESGDAEDGGRVQKVRRGELELDGCVISDDPDLLAVGRMVGQVVPSDGEARATVKPSIDRHRPRRRPLGPDTDEVDRHGIAGDGPHHGEVVDDAAEHDVRVQRPERSAGRTKRRLVQPRRVRLERGQDRRSHVTRRLQQSRVGQLPAAAPRPEQERTRR